VIAATASTANLLGILGGIVIFGDPLGNDPVTVAGRLVAFSLAVIAVGLVPAPTRAGEAVRKQEEEKPHVGRARAGVAPTSLEVRPASEKRIDTIVPG
jgi:hypothetical protein